MRFKFSVFVLTETSLRTNLNKGQNPFQLTTLVRCRVLQDSACLGTEINQSAVDQKLVAGFSLPITGSIPTAVWVEYLVDEVSMGQVSVQVLRFPSQFLLHQCSSFICHPEDGQWKNSDSRYTGPIFSLPRKLQF